MSDQLPLDACVAVAADLDAYLDGESGPAERAAVEGHLAACETCRAEVALLRLVAQSLQQVPWPKPSEAMRQRLRARVAADVEPHRVEILCIERQGHRVARRHEVRHYPEAPGHSAPPAALPPAAGTRIQQDRQVSASGSGLRCVIASSYSRG